MGRRVAGSDDLKWDWGGDEEDFLRIGVWYRSTINVDTGQEEIVRLFVPGAAPGPDMDDPRSDIWWRLGPSSEESGRERNESGQRTHEETVALGWGSDLQAISPSGELDDCPFRAIENSIASLEVVIHGSSPAEFDWRSSSPDRSGNDGVYRMQGGGIEQGTSHVAIPDSESDWPDSQSFSFDHFNFDEFA
jgi:hypothetical protein